MTDDNLPPDPGMGADASGMDETAKGGTRGAAPAATEDDDSGGGYGDHGMGGDPVGYPSNDAATDPTDGTDPTEGMNSDQR